MTLTNDDLQAIANLMNQATEPINNRLDKVENRLDKVESQVSALRAGQMELRKELKEVNIKVSKTYDLALEAWGTSIENRKWLEATN